MLNFPNQKGLSESDTVAREDVIIFFTLNGYKGDIKLGSNFTTLYSGKMNNTSYVDIPNDEHITVARIKTALLDTAIPFSDFEEYMENVYAMREMKNSLEIDAKAATNNDKKSFEK